MFAEFTSGVRGFSALRGRAVAIAFGLAGFLFLAGAPLAVHAQFPETPTVPESMLNSPALKPPAGSNVAIVEFDDLECPACAAANPTLEAAAKKYRVPWIRHDFLIPGHVWSPQAAVNARYFDTKSKQIGDDYRNQVFAAQQTIATRDDLNQFTQKFAQQNNLQMPFVVDPQGKFMGEIRADIDLAHALGLNRTPTIFVVTAHSHDPGHAFAQLSDPTMLYSYLDQAVSATSTSTTTAIKHTHK
jgi:protein-disulfide isomerase